ncbi:MAG: peptidoglycan DD-metalloendopeptidase family protein [Clostridia bacterium]|nr:peptidoglycan DD-metalloendopeptidase family protein [Clostridia bacterium]MDD4798726.1 peptidoglycan DD-metalloendopeptidase family protein [Clostridia bacterium]
MYKYNKKLNNKIAYIGAIILIFALVAAFCFAPSIGGATTTDPLAEYERQKAELEQKLAEQQKVIKDQRTERNGLESDVAAIDAKINRLELDAQAADIQIEVAENQLKNIQKELASTKARLDKQVAYLQGRVENVYVQGDISFWSVLLDCESFSDFLLTVDFLDAIVAQDITIVDKVCAYKKEIEAKEALQAQRLTDLEVLKQSKVDAIAALGPLQEEKSAAVAAINKELWATAAYIDALEQASKDITEEIRALKASTSGDSSFDGIFTWPLPGYTYITSNYGYRTHPVTGVKKSFHTGIDIRAPKGTKIVAAEDGTVIKAGWNNVYGNMVMIDHNGGVVTLYGHLSRMSVAKGKTILRGEKVGEVGTTGLSTGNHLHFEVRVDGKHTSPWNYLNK